jgi:hypothetical protein
MSEIQIQLEITRYNKYKSTMKIFRQLCKESKFIEIANLIRDTNCIIFKRLSFDYACKGGYKDIAEWIYNNYFKNNSHEFTEYFNEYLINLFYNICSNGKLEVAKWLVQIKPQILKNEDNNYFATSCENGHLHLADWLLQTMKKMDKKIDIILPFRFALFHKQYKLAKWLLDTVIYDTLQINVLLEYAFNFAKNDYDIDIEIIRLIQLYRPFMYCEREDEYEIINGALQLRFSKPGDILYNLYINNNNSKSNEINDRIDYMAIELRMHFVPKGYEISFKEELMRERFHPINANKWNSWGLLEDLE